MWWGSAVIEKRLERQACCMCWTTGAEVPAELLCSSQRPAKVRPLLRACRSTFAGVLCPLGLALCVQMWVLSLAPGPWHGGCQQLATPFLLLWDGGKGSTKCLQNFQFLMIPKGQCKWEDLMPGKSKALRLVPGTGQGNESIRHWLAARGVQQAPRIWHTAH